MKQLLTTVLCALSVLASFGVEVTVFVSPTRCNLINGRINAVANGGVPPYTYLWSTGATTPSIQDLAPGDYTVTVTDGLSNTAQATATVEALFAMGSGGISIQLQPDCQGLCTGIASAPLPFGGTPPYSYPPGVSEGGGFPGELAITDICASSPGTITIWDANGCPGEIDLIGVITLGEPASISVQATSPACEGESNGSMTILMDGPFASIMNVIRVGGGYEQLHFPAWNVPYTITDLPAGDYELISSILADGGSGGPLCSTTYAGSVPEISGPCGGVSGRVYHDADEDCTFNGFDLGLPYRMLAIEPGGQFAITDGTGNYQCNLAYGAYSIDPIADPDEEPICPASGSSTIVLDAAVSTATSDFANLSTAPHDLSVSINGSPARPGFNTQVWFTVTNHSAFPSGSLEIALSYDNLLLNTSTSAWSVPVIPPYGSQQFQFTALVPADVGLLGVNLNYGVTVTNSSSEMNTANNTAFFDITITGSYDPNDKVGTTNISRNTTRFFLDIDTWIDYTVRFQNTGTDTAFTVVIRDTLESDLDVLSLEILGASHAFTPSFGGSRELVFTFNDILLPDSTTDLLGSQGFVAFRMKPRTGLQPGDMIINIANIYFDFNPPIITEPSVLVAEFSTGVEEVGTGQALQVFPNPTDHVLTILLPDAVQPYALEVLTIDGRVVALHRVSGPAANVNVGELAAGPYSIRVIRADGTEQHGRFFKQ
jgi:uncharacterized repeat protein (TIGR01451 family)